MKKLYVSLKVRLVANGYEVSPNVTALIGKVGIITKKLDFHERARMILMYGAKVEWEVLVEGGHAIYSRSECLEPILPSGFTASTESYEECMERLRKGVVDELPS